MKLANLSLILVIAIFLSLANLSALNFDNVKEFEKQDLKYGKITIKNFFGLGNKAAEIILKENTDTCLNNCHAIGETTLYHKERLFDDLIIKKYVNGKWGESEIEELKIYIKVSEETETIKKYKKQKEKIKIKGKDVEEISYIEDGFEEINVPIWEEYNGEKLEPGTYEWKIEGKKKAYETVDWIGTLFGSELDEWALWEGSEGPLAYYKMDSSSGTNFIDHLGTYNGTLTNYTSSNWTTGKIGNGLKSTLADNPYVDAVINLTGDGMDSNMTVSLWINTTDSSSIQSIFGKDEGGVGARDSGLAINRFNVVSSSGKVILEIGNDGSQSATSVSTVTDGLWHHVAFTLNGSVARLYVDGQNEVNSTYTGDSGVIFYDVDYNIGANTVSGSSFNGVLDELGFWNRTLSPKEINDLYNNGNGLAYGNYSSNQTSLTITYPENTTYTSNISQLNYTFDPAVLAVDCWYSTDGGSSNSSSVLCGTNFTSVPFKYGNNVWTVYANSSFNEVNSTSVYFYIGIVENSQSFNATTYPGVYESFNINITYLNDTFDDVNATLVYNDTRYESTREIVGEETVYNVTIQIPNTASSVQKQFYWDFELANETGSYYENSTFQNQTISTYSFGFCNETFNVSYLNLTFEDEETGTNLSAKLDSSTWYFWLEDRTINQSYTFSNSSENPSYAFCFSPAHRTLNLDVDLRYESTGYPIRSYGLTGQSYTNVTTNTTLYLLGSSDGIYSSIQVLSLSNSPIQGVNVLVERQFDGIWTTIGEEVTDSSGLSTFWVNPNYDHRFTFSKTGYFTTTSTIRPSQSVYTQILSRSSDDATYNGSTKGMLWDITPQSGVLDSGQEYKFTFNLTAPLDNLASPYCQIRLVNASDSTQIFNSTTGGSSSVCNLSIYYTVKDQEHYKGVYLINTTDSEGWIIIDADSSYPTLFGNVSTWTTIESFFSDLKDLPEFGTGMRNHFSRIVFFFLMITVLIGVFVYFTGYDLGSPGFAFGVIWGIILIASIAGYFTSEVISDYEFINQYAIALVTGLYFGGYLFRYFNRA